MMHIPFFEELATAKKILISGAGGGFDIFGSLPLFYYLRALKKEVALASYSFTDLTQIEADFINEHCTIITHETAPPREYFYFPEKIMADWFFLEENIEIPIYTIKKVGPKLLRETYEEIYDGFSFDIIILVDGGTDSLLRGDEQKIGTFYEDVTSIVAVDNLNVENPYKSFLAVIGMGVDVYHGVSNYDVLKAIAHLIKNGGFLGSLSLTKEMDSIRKYISLVEYANKKLPHEKTIVHNSIKDAISGKFGNYHSTDRTKGSKLFINPLMAQMWFFNLYHVVSRLPYAAELSEATTLDEVEDIIQNFRQSKNLNP